jgi:hypothetical protein
MPDSGPQIAQDLWPRPAVILVATDLTELDRLVPFAFEQAAETGAQLILLHVIASGTGGCATQKWDHAARRPSQ